MSGISDISNNTGDSAKRIIMSYINGQCWLLLRVSSAVSLTLSTFNPADYNANSGARQETWDDDGNESERTSEKNDSLCTFLIAFSNFM